MVSREPYISSAGQPSVGIHCRYSYVHGQTALGEATLEVQGHSLCSPDVAEGSQRQQNL